MDKREILIESLQSDDPLPKKSKSKQTDSLCSEPVEIERDREAVSQ